MAMANELKPTPSSSPVEEPVSNLEAHIGYWLRFVSNHVSHSFQLKVEANGVTVSEWVLMREIYRLGRTSPSDLVTATGLSKGAVSKLLTRLEAKALMSRAVVDRDRRNHVVQLTPEGRELVPRLARLADQNDEEFFGHLPEERRAGLAEAMRELVRHHELKEVPVE